MRHGPRATGVTKVTEADDAVAATPAAEKNPGRAGWLFGAVTVVPALLAAAWLLPAFPLLLAGRLAARPMVFMFAPLAAGLCYFAVRQLPAAWPAFGEASSQAREDRSRSHSKAEASQAREASKKPASKPATQWWALAATVAIAVAFTVWQLAERTEQIIYLRDPATYLQVAYWIAHHGLLPIPDNAAAFGGPHLGLGFASSNYYPRGTGIVPQFMTGAPLVLAAGIWLHGISGALLVTPVIGGCAVLSFGGLAGRLAGPGWAPAAAAVLALSLPEQYTSRGSFSEPLAQVLLFGGLCLLADSLVINRNPGKKLDWPGQDKVLAALAGLALGLTIGVRIDGLSDILPAVPFLGVLLAARRRQAVPFGVALVIGVGYGLADGYLKSRPYLDLEAPSLRPLGYIVAATIVATAAGIAITASQKARGTARRLLETRTARYLPAAAAALTVLIFVGFAVRPLVQTVAGETNPTSIAYVAELQKLAGLPVNGHRQYYEDSLYWVIWYLGVPAVLLGAFGLAVLAKRTTKALLTWKDPTAAARVWALPLMMAIWTIVTVLYRPAVSPDQPWASRRLVPFVLPGLILGGIWAAAWLKGQGRPARPDPGHRGHDRLVLRGLAAHPDRADHPRPELHENQRRRRARHGVPQDRHRRDHRGRQAVPEHPPGSSVVILDPLTADRFAQVVRGICNTPTAILSHPSALSAVVQGIEKAGRRPVLLAENADELPGTPKQVVDLLTTQEAHNLTAPPTRTWLIHYTVWMSTPSPALAG